MGVLGIGVHTLNWCASALWVIYIHYIYRPDFDWLIDWFRFSRRMQRNIHGIWNDKLSVKFFFFVQIQEILELLFINQMYLRVMRFVQIIGVNCLFFMWKKREKKTRWKNQSIFDIKRQPASYVTNIWIRFNRERDREKKIIERIHIC